MRHAITIPVSILAGAAAFALFAWLFPTASIDTFTPKSLAQEAGGVRNVTPIGITPGPPVQGPLTRIPGVEPPPDPPQWRRFFQPVALSAGTFELAGAAVRLKGIRPTEPERECKAGAEAWPCGRVALTSFRNMLRGRAIECFWGREEGEAPAEAPCRIGGTDLSLWLSANGWADAGQDAGSALTEAARAARCAELGIWRGAGAECATVQSAARPDSGLDGSQR